MADLQERHGPWAHAWVSECKKEVGPCPSGHGLVTGATQRTAAVAAAASVPSPMRTCMSLGDRRGGSSLATPQVPASGTVKEDFRNSMAEVVDSIALTAGRRIDRHLFCRQGRTLHQRLVYPSRTC
jgi:hypothetical protein